MNSLCKRQHARKRPSIFKSCNTIGSFHLILPFSSPSWFAEKAQGHCLPIDAGHTGGGGARLLRVPEHDRNARMQQHRSMPPWIGHALLCSQKVALSHSDPWVEFTSDFNQKKKRKSNLTEGTSHESAQGLWALSARSLGRSRRRKWISEKNSHCLAIGCDSCCPRQFCRVL